MTTIPDTREAVRAWLLDYAWLGNAEEQAAEVECILAQDEWQHLSGRVDHLMGQRSGENTVEQDHDTAVEFALSALYECHTGPHLPTCPRVTD